MAPECLEMYFRLHLECYLENLNPLRPLQDLPSFQKKIGIKISNQDHIGKNLSNDKSLEVYLAVSQKNLSCTIFDKENDILYLLFSEILIYDFILILAPLCTTFIIFLPRQQKSVHKKFLKILRTKLGAISSPMAQKVIEIYHKQD